uniref:C-type lectin domain-containing protein n=1 Tax=Naja naja TaxID=35670 RepID=A0A8C6YFN5_NAJNA
MYMCLSSPLPLPLLPPLPPPPAIFSLGFLFSPTGTGADPSCPFEWSSYNGHCYKVVKKFRSWPEAEMFCRQQEEGSHLASIQSLAESAYVANLVSRNVVLINVWIGLSDPQKVGPF